MNVRAADDVHAVLDELGLAGALPEVGAYINRQRWSGAQDTTVREVSIDDAALLNDGDPTLLFTVTRVTYADARVRRYALPLGLRPVGDVLAERAPTFMIATIPDEQGGKQLYDALGDPAYLHWLWRAIREERTVPTQQGAIRCERTGVDGLEDVDTPWVRVLTVEQSNTSMELGDGMFLKHKRRIEPGPSHELEMARALSDAGFPHIAPVLADVAYDARDSEPAPLAMVQPYLRNSADGWALALTSLRDLYADAEEALATGRGDPDTVVQQQGGAFVGEAARLGEVIAQMHVALARSTDPGMQTEPVTAATLNAWAGAMLGELDALLESGASRLDPLRTAQRDVRAQFEALRTAQPGGLCTRIHGDLHLGQTLRVDSGWVLLDFEGEPDRTPAERRALFSPLRDVAGMLRSFDYAAAVALTERPMPESADWEGLMAFGDAWAAANRRAFWAAYLESVGSAPLLPQLDVALVLRRAFELQKAVYEVRYELGHRPSWVGIPLRFLTRAGT
ncbi:MAG TPA: aminoglycoside phosphotransferase [Candidatus Dormibacteraeota bacterium]|nr:aminoglycoside phosphotransferase [Candidatus Dormibacteraeota bacterium]